MTTAYIHREKYLTRHGRYPWKYGYYAVLNGKRYAYGVFPLASIRAAMKREGATAIVETWK